MDDKTKRLIEAAQVLDREARGLIKCHEFALSADAGNSNMNCLTIASERFRATLTAFEAESDTPHTEGVMVPMDLWQEIKDGLQYGTDPRGALLRMREIEALSRGGK